jgi:transposase InsO family protein
VVNARYATYARTLRFQVDATRPRAPEENGKAERFIQTMLREWAYARPYRTSNQRTKQLAPWLRYHNRQRPHSA